MVSFNPITDLPDLTGKVAIVTGATSGLGYHAAQQLLRKGATVYLAVRNESKASGTIARLEKDGLGPGNGKPIFHKLVLDDPRDAKKSAEEFLAREKRLDILLNNASLLMKPYEMSKALPVQDVVVINHISPMVFTNTLLPLLKRTASEPGSDVRIVNIASSTHSYVTDVKFKTVSDFNTTFGSGFVASSKRYGLTKLLNVLYTRELARRLAVSTSDGGDKIICLCLHPGANLTEGNLNAVKTWWFPFNHLGKLLFHLFANPAEVGAYTYTIAAASPVVREQEEKYRGAYLVPIGKLSKTSKTAEDPQLAKDLWELTENVLKELNL